MTSIYDEIASTQWIKRWAGSYTFISCSYWGYQYYEELRKVLGVGFDHTLFIHRSGIVSFYLPYEVFEHFGKTMAKKTMTDPGLAKEWLHALKQNTDRIVPFMEKLGQKIPTWDEYEEFLDYFEFHLPYHNFMKKTVDFLPEDILEKLLPDFKDARLYSERVYSDTERFFRNVATQIAQRENRNADTLTCLTKKEFEDYLKHAILPAEDILSERYHLSALYFSDATEHLLLGQTVDTLEQTLTEKRAKETLRGMVGFRGKAQGRVRIVLDPYNIGEFDEGDILVTGMTRPEFMSVVQKAAAIVTDAGGVLCHAAIIARELRKPCIVGTEVATEVLHDGQLITVDAENGIITTSQ